jgi:hypothetical protein
MKMALESTTVDKRISPTPRNFNVDWLVEKVMTLSPGTRSAAAFVTEGTGCKATPMFGAELERTSELEEISTKTLKSPPTPIVEILRILLYGVAYNVEPFWVRTPLILENGYKELIEAHFV